MDIPILISKRARFLEHHFEQSQIRPIRSGGYQEEQFGSEMPNSSTFDSDTCNEGLDFSLCSRTEYNMSQLVEDTRLAISRG